MTARTKNPTGRAHKAAAITVTSLVSGMLPNDAHKIQTLAAGIAGAFKPAIDPLMPLPDRLPQPNTWSWWRSAALSLSS